MFRLKLDQIEPTLIGCELDVVEGALNPAASAFCHLVSYCSCISFRDERDQLIPTSRFATLDGLNAKAVGDLEDRLLVDA